MHKAFTGFQDEAIAGGLMSWNPSLAQSLRHSAAMFAELAKNGVHESDGEEDESPTAQPDENLEDVVGDILSSRDLRPEMPKHESDPGQRRRAPGADAGLGTDTIWGYSPTFESSFMPTALPQRSQNTIQSLEDVQMQNWDPSNEDLSSNQNLQLYQVNVPEPSTHPNLPGFVPPQPFWDIPNELPIPKTYSHHETSFARRLLRQSLEAAIELLSSPHSTPEELDRFCRFTFCYSNRPTALNCIKAMIRQSAYSNLEFWHVPIYHLGGSGLHYPRVGIDAGSNPPDNWADVGAIGPTFNPTPENARFSGIELANIIQELGVDGEWFDSNDVDQYLRSKGVHLNGSSSLVEIIEPDDEFNVPELGTGANTATSPSMTHSSINGPQSPQSHFSPTNAVIYGNEDLFNTDPLSYDDAVSEIDVNRVLSRSINGPSPEAKTAGIPDLDMNAFPELSFGHGQDQLQLESQLQPGQEQGSYFNLRKKRYVDVDKLIEGTSSFLSGFHNFGSLA